MKRTSGRLAWAIAAAIVLVLAPLAAAPASAATVTMAFADAKASFRYGAVWNIGITLNGLYCGPTACSSTVQVSYTGTRHGTFTTSTYGGPNSSTSNAYINSEQLDAPLAVGTYHFSATYSYGSYSGATTSDFVLTVTPAPIGTDLRVALDGQNPRNAIVTALLTGDYVSSLGGLGGGPSLPAGTWHVVAKDARGQTVLSQDVPRDAGSDPSVNVYWSKVTPQSYTVSASFSPASGVAGDFAMTDATGTRFSPSAPPHPDATPTPRTTPAAASTAASPTTPLWAAILVGLLVLLLALAVILVSVRLRPRAIKPSPSEEEVAVDAA